MKVLFIAAALLCAPMAAGATTIFSDDFETPDITVAFPGSNWRVYQDFGNWESTSGSGIEIQRNGAVSGITANSGVQYVELDSDNARGGEPGPTNSSMTTMLNLAGGSYRLDWYYRPRTGTPNDNTISAYLAGYGENLFTRLLGTMNETTSTSTGWELVSFFFNVEGKKNMYALTFRAVGNPNSLGGFIDDVSVAAVPVPAAGFLLLGALGGLAALRRRKAAA